MNIFNKSSEEFVELSCGEIVKAIPLTESEYDHMEELIQKRKELEESGKVLFMTLTKTLVGLRFRYRKYGAEHEG